MSRKQKNKILKRHFSGIALIIAVSYLWAGCSRSNNSSVSSVSESWLKIKTALISAILSQTDFDLPYPGDLDAQLDGFHDTLDRFFSSPAGSLYMVHNPAEMRTLDTIASAVEKLKAELQNKNSKEIFSIILEIDDTVELLRRIDTQLSDTSQMHYFQLFFFFSMLVIVIILVLRVMSRKVEKAETREQENLAFFREAIMAQEQERERISRELHDTALQDLWRLSFQTDSIGKAEDAVERSRLCQEVVSGHRELMRQIRGICENLVPPDFHHHRLVDILQSLCYNFEQRTGIECQVLVQNTKRSVISQQLSALGSIKQLHCFRIVQECLANIEKHAGASEVSVLIRSSDRELVICVSDNGKGLSPDLSPDLSSSRDFCRTLRVQGHFGLWNMSERAAALGGTFTIDSEDGEGTMVTLSLPLEETKE